MAPLAVENDDRTHPGARHAALAYVFERLPPARVLTPLVLGYVCVRSAASSNSGTHAPWPAVLATGVSFLLLFVQLRLVDDLDDLDVDHAARAPAERGALRRRLRWALVLVFGALLALNAGRLHALLYVAGATALSYTGPFVIKRHCPPRPAFLMLAFLVFEGAPASFFLYAALGLSQAAGPAVPAAAALWFAYEFWKFSRKAHLDATQPYLLRKPGLRVALTALALGASSANAALAFALPASPLVIGYLTLLPLAFAAWLNVTWPLRPWCGVGAPGWTGMTYMLLLEAGIAIGLGLRA